MRPSDGMQDEPVKLGVKVRQGENKEAPIEEEGTPHSTYLNPDDVFDHGPPSEECKMERLRNVRVRFGRMISRVPLTRKHETKSNRGSSLSLEGFPDVEIIPDLVFTPLLSGPSLSRSSSLPVPFPTSPTASSLLSTSSSPSTTATSTSITSSKTTTQTHSANSNSRLGSERFRILSNSRAISANSDTMTKQPKPLLTNLELVNDSHSPSLGTPLSSTTTLASSSISPPSPPSPPSKLSSLLPQSSPPPTLTPTHPTSEATLSSSKLTTTPPLQSPTPIPIPIPIPIPSPSPHHLSFSSSPPPLSRRQVNGRLPLPIAVSELKRTLDQLGVDHSHCIEKQELLYLYLDTMEKFENQKEKSENFASTHCPNIQQRDTMNQMEGNSNGPTTFNSKSPYISSGTQKQPFVCPICYSDIPVTDLTKLQCGHIYCTGCIHLYLTGLIMNGDVERVVCPEPSCTTQVPYGDLKFILDAPTLEKYDRFSVRSVIRKEPLARWCPICDSVYFAEVDRTLNPRIICGECGVLFCFNCRGLWHDGKSCHDVQIEKTPEYRKTKKWMKRRGVQNCPHCGFATIRSTGCPTMTCPACKLTWEWASDPGETTLEKVAYFYPRSVHHVATSMEAHANDRDKFDEFKTNITTGGLAALILSPALLVTIPILIPALAVTFGRKTKRKISELLERADEDDE